MYTEGASIVSELTLVRCTTTKELKIRMGVFAHKAMRQGK